MPSFIRRRDLLVQLGAVSAGLLLPQGALSQGAVLEDLAAQIPEWMREFHVVGAAVAVVRGGKREWRGDFGWRSLYPRAPVEPSTIFEAASLSKPVFAYALLTLAAEGKFDLDRPLTGFMPQPFSSRVPKLMASEVPADPRLARITPRMVLSHSTGFPNWGRGKPLALQSEPGEKFGYSGEGYVYLQNVVEHVTGESLDDLVRARVFTPLRMPDSSFVWRADYDARAAIGYDRLGPKEKDKPKQALAAATLHTTAADFARFLSAILYPSAAGLDANWIEKMLSPQTKIDASLSWGLGWGLEERPPGRAFWQWGDNGEFKAFAMGSREEGTALIVLTNSALGLRLCRKIVEQVLPGPHPALAFGMLDYS